MDERAFPRPVGGPVLLNGSGGVKVVARCLVDGQIVNQNDPARHVCIPVEGGEPRKVSALEAEAEYLERLVVERDDLDRPER
jgi:hypothetical protein